MLDLVPLAGPRRVMADADFHAALVSPLLNKVFPGTIPAAIAPHSICTQEQLSGTLIMMPSQNRPPLTKTFNCKLSRVMSHANVHKSFITMNIISSVRSGFPFGQTRIIVHVHLFCLSLGKPVTPIILEVTDIFLLLGVNGENRRSTRQKLLHQGVNAFKLPVAIGWSRSLFGLDIGLKGVVHVHESSMDGSLTDFATLTTQFVRNGICGFTCPAKSTHRISRRCLLHHPFQQCLQLWICHVFSFSTTAGISDSKRRGRSKVEDIA